MSNFKNKFLIRFPIKMSDIFTHFYKNSASSSFRLEIGPIKIIIFQTLLLGTFQSVTSCSLWL